MGEPRGFAISVATCLGCGYAPVAPGTAGSAAALAVAIALAAFAGFRPSWFAALAAAAIAPAVWAADRTERIVRKLDPGFIVIDEVVGQWIAIAGATALNWKSWAGAFVLFRAFDILKPFPAGRLQALRGGFGVVADDVAAGLYAALVLYAAGCFNLY